ncbi:MAG: beta-N-acetylglucosaminidase domain-containing protein, partial [Candidatus Amesbacteria bacterium]|nr:beta-N-acetylglucosaminidase domain-containing protein [Candidatus Amesbacteria bacterium]
MWPNNDRLETISFLGQYADNLNTYLYCPKDDPYVVKKWGQRYPKKKLIELQQTIKLCQNLNIEFVFGLNPTLGKRQAAGNIIKKFNQLKEIGCDSFCLLFDDIPYAYDSIDNQKSNLGELVGKEIVNLTNSVYYKLGEPKQFWLCTPDYCFKKRSLFTKTLNSLNQNISLMWTGNNIFSKTISINDIERVRRITKCQKIIWWSNYPVNDCEQNVGVFNLGGFVKLQPSVLIQLDGVLVNPIREQYASFPFFITFSNYLINPRNYSRNNEWNNAIQKLNIKNKYGKRFLDAVKPAIIFKANYRQLILSIKKNNQINLKLLNMSEVFPTNPKIDRYFPEVFRIVRSRLKLAQSYQSLEIPKNVVNFENYFSTKYLGSKKLFVSFSDSIRAVNYSTQLIKLDQEYITNLLNKNDISNKDKL